MALAIGIATLLLLYRAEGFGIDRQGEVTQSGLVFVSSNPTNATVYLNDERYRSSTNTRLAPNAGPYTVKIVKDGYRPWERPIWVAGGDVQRLTYPLLIPQNLQTASLADLDSDPTLTTGSPNKRWVLLGRQQAGVFTQYDLKNPDKPTATELTLPTDSFNPGSGPQTWVAVEWAIDNRHVLLQHSYKSGNDTLREYIVLDRDTPANSVNLTNTLKLTQTQTVSLFNNGTDSYYVYDIAALTLRRVDGTTAEAQSTIEHVLAYKTYGEHEILYVSDRSAAGKTTNGQVNVILQDGEHALTLRTLPPAGNGTYVLNLATYNGDWYVAAASTSDSAAYIYQNPQDQQLKDGEYPAPWRRVQVGGVSFLSFSSNSQFLLAENGQQFAVYDLENIAQYHYTTSQPIDAPQQHAVWLDSHRIAYVSGAKLLMFDYDYRNAQTLVPANAAYTAFLASDYSYLYAVQPVGADTKAAFTATPLTVKKD